VKRYKARLVAKRFTQKECIALRKIFHLYQQKKFRIIMASVAHFDLELHQMYIKTIFLNGDIDECIYIS
jgi:Reverse transcriptase (RNA-dependent DNA polymerase)